MEDKACLVLPLNGEGYPYGVLATHKDGGLEELHGPFTSFEKAEKYIDHLKGKYTQYKGFRVCKIETPAVHS